MPDVWDTSVASRVYGDGRHAPLLAAHVRTRTPVPLPAPAIQEVLRGLYAHALQKEGFHVPLGWFTALLSDTLVEVIPFEVRGATLAGRLLALLPFPPTGSRRREGTRPRQRAAWALDVQIASCAFAGGYGVLTENVDDFAVLRDAISRALPGVPPLVVRDAREPVAAR